MSDDRIFSVVKAVVHDGLHGQCSALRKLIGVDIRIRGCALAVQHDEQRLTHQIEQSVVLSPFQRLVTRHDVQHDPPEPPFAASYPEREKITLPIFDVLPLRVPECLLFFHVLWRGVADPVVYPLFQIDAGSIGIVKKCSMCGIVGYRHVVCTEIEVYPERTE